MAANGQLPASALGRVWHPTAVVYLAHDGGAVAGWNTMQLHLSQIGVGRCIGNGQDSYYRNLARQRYWKNYWCARGACGNAAAVGYSNHGWGIAVDTNQRWKVWKYGRQFGWGPCTDAPWESWHTKRCGSFGRPNPGPDLNYPILRQGSGGTGQSARIRRLQTLLNQCGIRPGGNPIPVTGTFGPITRTGVLQFQKKAGWKAPTGICAKGTWVKLVLYAKNGWPKPPARTPTPA